MTPPVPSPSPPPFGAILAGGESSRYGSPKALASVGGRRIIDRVADALREVTPDLIVSANEPALFDDLGLPIYPDEREGLGPLAGIYTLLLRAREAGRPGVLAVACDMPFPCVRLLERLRIETFGDDLGEKPDPDGDPDGDPDRDGDGGVLADRGAAWLPDLVLPESRGRRGVEPLFAAYRVSCLPAIEAALEAGDRRMIGFHEAVDVRRIPLDVVASLCDPDRAFLNVNTPEDRERAERLAEPGVRDGEVGGIRG